VADPETGNKGGEKVGGGVWGWDIASSPENL